MPGSRIRRSEATLRSARRSPACAGTTCCELPGDHRSRDGYRRAKPQGKPNFTTAALSLYARISAISRPAAAGARIYIPFIANLKLLFKFDRP